jgi:threonine dehydrogenase-like Zn-dependent dehydrogenase
LNRSELFTRQGHSPNVPFPRVLGIEAVGEVVSAPDGEFSEGDTVATAMGGMGRQYDGGYAEYTLVPAGQVQQLETTLPWHVLGALPDNPRNGVNLVLKVISSRRREPCADSVSNQTNRHTICNNWRLNRKNRHTDSPLVFW